ncbi:hypothetical protein E3P92_02239 [Wallemia ichthyophaga]|nr:hypothetical protein E3P92_02239 [Wallemia ichthyophaga]TIB32050.1 hypothetical protein E3P84_02678 [Wallemia ichthyophaga]TIB40794.1 hypothetical protein E3P83_02615 [Wallemia ichthyophaga]
MKWLIAIIALVQVICGFKLESINIPEKIYFHQFNYKQVSQNKTALVTHSNKDINVLNPSDGKLLNRINFDNLISYKFDQDVLASLDSQHTLRLFDGHSLHEFWNKTLAASSDFQVDFTKDDKHSILVLDNNHLRCFNILSADLLWELQVHDNYRLQSQSNFIYLYNSNEIMSLDPSSGDTMSKAKLEDHLSTQFTRDYLILLNKHSRLSIIDLKSLKPITSSKKSFKTLVDLNLSSKNIFSAVYQDDLLVYTIEMGVLNQLHAFKYDPTLTYFNGYLDKHNRAFIVQTSPANALRALTVNIFTPDGPDGKLESSYTLPFDQTKRGTPIQIISEATLANNYSSVARMALITTSGTMELYQGLQIKWVKELGLSDPLSLTMVDLPEKDEPMTSIDNNQLYSFIPRILSHFHNIKYFPRYIVNFGSRFLTGDRHRDSTSLVRDLFGYRKIVIVGTKQGKLIGLDSANPNKTLWSRNFGSNTRVTHLINTRSAGINDAAHVLALVEYLEINGKLKTLAIEVDALGGPALTGSGSVAYLSLMESRPIKIIPLDIECGSSGNRAIALIDEELGIHLYPFCKTVRDKFDSISNDFYYTLQVSEDKVNGYKPMMNYEDIESNQIWSFFAPENQAIVGVQERINSATASVAQIGPNREAIEKYLNPHAVLITTVIADTSMKQLYVVDGVTGQVEREYTIEDESEEENSVFIDNRIITVARTMDMSTIVHSKELFVNVEDLKHEYLYSPNTIKAISPTVTRNGITHKDLIIANDNDDIISIPRLYLDPNTPKQMHINKLAAISKGKKNNSQFDMVINSDLAKIPNDPKAILNEDPVIGVKDIQCVPSTQLESTSICVAYGQDIFMFRVSPSRQFDVLSESFNKIQLAITILALSIGLIIVKPIVSH